MNTQDKTAHALSNSEVHNESFSEIMELSKEEKRELLKMWKERHQERSAVTGI